MFEKSLQKYLEDLDRPNAKERQLMRIMALPKSNPRRQRVMKQVELAAKSQLQADGKVGAIDWGAIDWEKLLASIMKLIEMIIKLFA